MVNSGNARLGLSALIAVIALTVGVVAMATKDAEASPAAQIGCWSCYETTHCLAGEHMDEYMYDFWKGGSGIHPSCRPFRCSEVHDSCMQSLEASEDLKVAEKLLTRKQWGALAKFIAESPRAEFNAERGALQFTGCGGALVAHLPLGEKAAAQVARGVARYALND